MGTLFIKTAPGPRKNFCLKKRESQEIGGQWASDKKINFLKPK
jgi:hypothetical protein